MRSIYLTEYSILSKDNSLSKYLGMDFFYRLSNNNIFGKYSIFAIEFFYKLYYSG